MPGFSDYLNILKICIPYAEDDTFKWDNVISLLILKLSNTDSLNKEREESNATQIQLTSERDGGEELRKTEDFFPTLTMNKTFKSWRISIPTRICSDNVLVLDGKQPEGKAEWLNDTIQLRRRLLNADALGNNGNPNLQMCYGNDLMPIRKLLQVDDYLVIAKRKNSTVYEAFGVKKDTDLGKGKQMYISEKASQDGSAFDLENMISNGTSDQSAEKEKSMPVFKSGLKSNQPRNRIVFGAPGTGKSFAINSDRKKLLGDDNEEDYERVTFHPDYSYANFVGTYKPVMKNSVNSTHDPDVDYVLSVLNDKSTDAQEKYDILFDKFKDDRGMGKLSVLISLYTDGSFKPKNKDGSGEGCYSNEQNYGKAIKKYVNLRTLNDEGGDISYEYVPGPFMRMYVKALRNAKSGNPKPFVLIIEEINRANVAAVFGEIFQLLDRGEDNISEYPIQASEDIRKYLSKELGGTPDDYSQLRIPDNLFIWATMNSADQGVFPMDTAFKRRWEFTYLGIDENDKEIRGKYVVLNAKEQQRIEWNELRKAINEFLANEKINEDKQLGPYFISRRIVVPGDGGNEINSKKFCDAFKNKVLMYLFEDAAKQKRGKLFEGCEAGQNRYSKICEAFDEKGIGIFAADIRNTVHLQNVDTNTQTPSDTDPDNN